MACYLHRIVIYEFLGKVMRHAINAASQAFRAGCLPRLREAFDLVFLAFRACGKPVNYDLREESHGRTSHLHARVSCGFVAPSVFFRLSLLVVAGADRPLSNLTRLLLLILSTILLGKFYRE